MATQDLAATDLAVRVLNEDDNLPEFVDPTVYFFVYNPLHSSGRGRYPAVGRVRATDADGDALLYRVRGGAGGAKGAEGPSAALRGGGCCIVVPQTGEVIVVNGEFNATVLSVDAVERDNKVSRRGKMGAYLFVEILSAMMFCVILANVLDSLCTFVHFSLRQPITPLYFSSLCFVL